MLISIPSLINTATLSKVRELLDRAPYNSGQSSAGLLAALVKNNLELDRQSDIATELDQLIMTPLTRHPTYKSAVLPRRIATPFYARYNTKMQYGEHIDDPIMGPANGLYRSDVAITIFLNQPSEYSGGELTIQSNFGQKLVKLKAGDAILYPASSLHKVNPITRGERCVAVTWAQSLVRGMEQREMLYDLYLARESLLHDDQQKLARQHVNKTYNNLLRMWSEL